jgi:hypothetical protein
MLAMFTAVLVVHSYLRWLVLAFAAMAVLRGVAGWHGKGLFTPADDRAGRFFTVLLDVQLLLGLMLYFVLSPVTRAAMTNFGEVMGNSVLRFWAVEHIFGMLVAVALAHIGRAKTRRLNDSTSRHKAAAIYFGLALLIILATIPWPFMPAARPLFRY